MIYAGSRMRLHIPEQWTILLTCYIVLMSSLLLHVTFYDKYQEYVEVNLGTDKMPF